MSARFRMMLAVLLLLPVSTGWSALPDSIDGQPMPSLAPLVQQVAPAVVNIRVSQTFNQRSPYGDEMFRRFFGLPDMPGGSQEIASAGSGVIVDAKNGYILTNHHVVENANEIQISLLNEKTLDAEIVAYPNYGYLDLNSNGSFSYFPDAGYVGSDTRSESGNRIDGDYYKNESASDDYEVEQIGVGSKNFTLTITVSQAESFRLGANRLGRVTITSARFARFL